MIIIVAKELGQLMHKRREIFTQVMGKVPIGHYLLQIPRERGLQPFFHGTPIGAQREHRRKQMAPALERLNHVRAG